MKQFEQRLRRTLFLLLVITLFSATVQAVDFRVVLPQAPVYVGQTFDVQIYLDVPTGEPITYAEFELQSTGGVSRISETGENLLSSSSTINDNSLNWKWRYAETVSNSGSFTPSNYITGNNLLFATATYLAGSNPRVVQFDLVNLDAFSNPFSNYVVQNTQAVNQRTLQIRTPTTEISCNNNADDDNDGRVDCLDTDCIGDPACLNRANNNACADNSMCASGNCVINLCKPLCGNGIVETGEQCESGNLNGQSCTTQGFTSGNLKCNSATCTFDTSLCQSIELCNTPNDDDNDGLINCADTDCIGNSICSGFGLGKACIDGSMCASNYCDTTTGVCTTQPVCGNGVIEAGEICDKTALGTTSSGQPVDCTNFQSPSKFTSGALGCASNCQNYDMSRCSVSSGLLGDTDNDGRICTPELFPLINQWYANAVTTSDLFTGINSWYVSRC